MVESSLFAITFNAGMVMAWISLFALGLGAAWIGSRFVGHGSKIRIFVLLFYIVRSAAGLMVFALSMVDLPLLSSRSAGPGLWRVIPDTLARNQWATDQAVASWLGVPFGLGVDAYTAFVGFVYALVGLNPLTAILLNPIFDVVTLLFLVRLSHVVGNHALLPGMVVLFALWPSWVFWSTQLLRESILLCLSVIMLSVLVSMLQDGATTAREKYWRVVNLIVLILCGAAVWQLRKQMIDVVLVALALTLLWSAVMAWLHAGSWRKVLISGCLLLLLLASMAVLWPLLDVTKMVGVPQAVGYLELGMALERRGDVTAAMYAYKEARSYGAPPKEVAQARKRLGARGAPAAGRSLSEIIDGLLTRVVRAPVSLAKATIERLRPRTLQGLRRQNLGGGSRFGEGVDVTEPRGFVTAFSSGLLHVLFSPFPWEFRDEGSTGILRNLAMVELPWVYLAVLLGPLGGVVVFRVKQPAAVFIAFYALVGLVGLAVAVPNVGLLFRYRLMFVVPLALLIPLSRGLTRVSAVASWVSVRFPALSAHSAGDGLAEPVVRADPERDDLDRNRASGGR